jgi:2-iminobutanoate/2-iminopropanoate deaminase
MGIKLTDQKGTKMTKTAISTKAAPAAIGPYSQAIRAGSWLFVSGQIPLIPETGQTVAGGIAIQTRQVMENIRTILAEAGLTMNAICKCTIYLTDLNDFAEVNEVYGSFFADPAPARATVAVAALPKAVHIEIDATAFIGE